MSNMTPACPICATTPPEDLGPPVYHLPTEVAGVPLDVTELKPHWWRCPQCGYMFIHPMIPQEWLEKCYAIAEAGHWETGPEVAQIRKYGEKKQMLERLAPGKRVLDFGCFDGGFLSFLGDEFDRYGIEPSTKAARVAEAHGAKILGGDIASAAASPPMDAIVSFDVFEHVPDPLSVLRGFHDRLAERGIVMIETGNSDHPYWQRVGKWYPYMSVVSHIGVFNESSMAEAAKRTGFRLEQFHVTAHHVLTRRYRMECVMKRSAYWMMRGWDRFGMPLPASLRIIARGPVPHVSGDDHFLAILRRD